MIEISEYFKMTPQSYYFFSEYANLRVAFLQYTQEKCQIDLVV